jgi:hypothetical protein
VYRWLIAALLGVDSGSAPQKFCSHIAHTIGIRSGHHAEKAGSIRRGINYLRLVQTGSDDLNRSRERYQFLNLNSFLQGRKLKSVMSRKADPNRDSDPEHELHVARYLAVAFIAQGHGIGMDYARKKYAHMPGGSFWVDIARQVIAHMVNRGGQPEFIMTIQ